MYNNTPPSPAELPTSRQLLRSTIIAIVAAAVILTTVVLPSEYGIDPIGVGRVLGLTEMGEIKAQLAAEAAADATGGAMGTPGKRPGPEDISVAPLQSVPADAAIPAADPSAPAAAQTWRDEMRVVLKPGEGAEVKLGMRRGERAEFEWLVEGGAVNYDMHGEGSTESTSYEKGRNASSGSGTLESAFDGNHGWFWRNRGTSEVIVLVRARGQYAAMKRVM